MTDQKMSVFPIFSVQVVFKFVTVGKTLVEMLYNFPLHVTKQFSAEIVLQFYKFLSVSGVSRVKIERNDV